MICGIASPSIIAATAPTPEKFMPWELVFYAALQDEVTARKFESYLKSGSGRAFARKHLLQGRSFEHQA